MRTCIEKAVEYNNPFLLNFVDIYEGLDPVELLIILKALKERIGDHCYVKIISNIYETATPHDVIPTVLAHTRIYKRL